MLKFKRLRRASIAKVVLGVATLALITTQVQVQVAFTYTPLLQVLTSFVQQLWLMHHGAVLN